MKRVLMCLALAFAIGAPWRAVMAAEAQEKPRQGLKLISEIRLGFLLHDRGLFVRREESGFDGTLELLFDTPQYFHYIGSPRPHLGTTINSDGGTNLFVVGLSWQWDLGVGLFAGFSLGGAMHDGKLKTERSDQKELGCRFLFRGSIEFGIRFGERSALSLMTDHMANGGICNADEGLGATGVRYGYRF